MSSELNDKKQLLLLVNKCEGKLGIPFLVVGAAARDLLIEQQDQGGSPPSSTLDVDVACRVSDWTTYNKLYTCLLEQEQMSEDATMVHRLLFRWRVPLDLLPFGAIGGEGQSITWPERDDLAFTVAGFEEAYQSSVSVSIGGETFTVASFAAIAWLKLAAWHDIRSRTKDLADIWFIIDNYLEFVSDDRIYAEDGIDRDIFDDERFSAIRAGSRLLGRDMVRQGGRMARELLGRLMDGHGEPCDALVHAMRTVVPSYVAASNIIDMFAVLWSEVGE
jgi:predicted nucleotidyltransferase